MQIVRKQNTEILDLTTKMAEMEIRHEQEKADLLGTLLGAPLVWLAAWAMNATF